MGKEVGSAGIVRSCLCLPRCRGIPPPPPPSHLERPHPRRRAMDWAGESSTACYGWIPARHEVESCGARVGAPERNFLSELEKWKE